MFAAAAVIAVAAACTLLLLLLECCCCSFKQNENAALADACIHLNKRETGRIQLLLQSKEAAAALYCAAAGGPLLLQLARRLRHRVETVITVCLLI